MLLKIIKYLSQDTEIELIIDSCEINRGGISYTYDTAKNIYENYNLDGKLGLLMGDDLVPSLNKWYCFDKLASLVDIIVCRREEKRSYNS